MTEKLSKLAAELAVRIDYLETTSSTNDVAAQGCYDHGDAIIAEHQSKGRGQRGNIWKSSQNQNLTFSIVVSRGIAITKQFYISKCVALGIVAALKAQNEKLEVKIKWPNDIYVGDKKICGILIENDISGYMVSKSVVGIGVNVNQDSFDPALPNPTSLKVCCGREFDRAEVFEGIYRAIIGYFEILEGRGENSCEGGENRDSGGSENGCGEEQISRLYLENLFRYGSLNRFNDPRTGTFSGTIVGVEEDGQLIIKDHEGALRRYYFKEVEYII